MPEIKDFTKYEKTRILGARALQIAIDAPLLKNISNKKLEEIEYNPMDIAQEELEADSLPITIKQPMPKKKSVIIKKFKVEDKKEDDKEIIKKEIEEEKEIEEGGEIMELATPEDEEVSEEKSGREASEEL